jgi:cytochrome b6-f complex iron-sulfur subunit
MEVTAMTRRQLIWAAVAAFLAVAFASLVAFGSSLMLMLLRLLLPRPAFEPSSVFRIGPLSDFNFGVNTQFQQQYRICVVRNAERLYVLYARCTHLGCTPDWKATEKKFKCSCHGSSFCYGSAFDGDGIKCEGPAPRPMDRAHVELDSAGQVVVDVSKLYQWPQGGHSEFDDPSAYIPISRS